MEGVTEAEQILDYVRNWKQAYPEDMFSKPDWNEVRQILGDSLLSDVSAANMLHVLNRVESAILGIIAANADSSADYDNEVEA